MTHTVYAMDTYFSNSIGAYPYEVRCEMLRELGYDATYLTLWSDREWAELAKVATTKATYGLDVAAVYTGLDIAADKDDANVQRLLTLFDRLPDGSELELPLHSSDASIANSSPAGDDLACARLEPLLAAAERHGSVVCIYPHINMWGERIDDGVRLCRKLEHPCLKVVFCGFHWYAADGKDLSERIREAAPYLHAVNLCGTRRGGTVAGCTIEPLDCGEMDNFALLGLLRGIGYTGRIGFQGYAAGGDTYAYLKRSLATFREMEDRLNEHPHWADLHFKSDT